MVKLAKEQGLPALALTDHGVMYGAIEFYKECKKAGIKPIIGMEAYMALGKLSDKKSGVDDDYNHLTLLAMNMEGYKNLMKLTTIGHLEGFYYKPRIDKEVLKAHSAGVIALSGCLRGEIARALVETPGSDEAKYAKAREITEEYLAIFGTDRFFAEVQHHPELPEQEIVNRGMFKLCKEYGFEPVATIDSHYLERSDAEAQDILVCVQTGKFRTDKNRLDMTTTDLSMKTPQVIMEDWKEHPEVVANTLAIADMCNLELELNKWNFARYPLPEGKTTAEHLWDLVIAGAQEKLGSKTDDLSDIPQEQIDRIKYEFDVITKKGYDPYFLIVSDYIKWARSVGIVTTTRGSAAGSFVSYLIDIVAVNPLDFRLPFERFLTVHRPSPPDVDGDFADNRRGEVIEYMKSRYGADKVAQIVTFGTMLPRAAVRDVTRVLGYPYSFGDRISKMIPQGSQGFHMTVDRALEENPDLKKFAKEDRRVEEILNLARKLEGCVRHASVHAAGVVIAPTTLNDFTPLQKEADGENLITQYDMHSVEAAGLLKMDILGIRNLSILGEAIKIVKATKGVDVDIHRLPLDDKATFQLLSRGDTMGVFQLSGSGMTRYLKELKPTTIHDIMAMVALFRPGPMESIPEYIRRKYNPKLATFLDERLRPILERTFGILVYQDDVLLTAIELAGYSWEEADKFRKAMGKKIPAEMAAQKEKFFKGCLANNVSEHVASELWTLIEPFAAYGFNKAHAASYAMVAYQTAYMKAHYPAEFITAILTAEAGNMEKVAEVIASARESGITVLPPSVNESYNGFTYVDEQHIRFGLLAVKNVGADIVDAIIETRKIGGPFISLEDLLQRVQHKGLNKKSLESLIKAGAMDAFGDRAIMLENMDELLAYHKVFMEGATKQASLFGSTPMTRKLTLKEVPPATKDEILQWERELLGLYVSEHPLQELQKDLAGKVTTLDRLEGMPPDTGMVAAGVLIECTIRVTKNGEKMAVGKFQDLLGSCELVGFPKTFAADPSVWEPGALLVAWGRGGGEEKRIIADRVARLSRDNVMDLDFTPPTATKRWNKNNATNGGGYGGGGYRAPQTAAVPTHTIPQEKRLVVSLATPDKSILFALKDVFEKYNGSGASPVFLELPEGAQKRLIGTAFRVEPSSECVSAITAIIEAAAGTVRIV